MTFASLGLSEDIVRAVTEHGYTEPTPIQLQAIPAVLSGGDLLAGAQTGTGKTAGFTLPILQLLSQKPAANPGKGRPRCLMLTPTRELAAQIEASVQTYGKYVDLSTMVIFGGVNANPQITRLKKPLDILVATPGRLLDHANQKNVDLSGVEILVLDEADRMLDMGFIRDIKKILALLPKQRQNLLFSATFSDEIKELTDSLLHNPALIEVARRNATAELIKQKIVLVDREKKRDLLAHLIKEQNWFQVLVFTRTKHGANRLAEQLDKAGIPSLAIHGNKSQAARTRALKEFKDGSLQVLVATDIAARGIDIAELPHVVNFELPHVPEDYVHRIGRTGRAGVEGEAMSLVCVDEHKLLRDIERVIKREFPKEIIPGFEPDLNARPEPIMNGQNRGQDAGRNDRGSNQRPNRSPDVNSERSGGRNAGRNSGRGSEKSPSRNAERNPSQRQGQGQGQRHAPTHSQLRSTGNIGGGEGREVDGNRAQPTKVIDGNRGGALHRSGGRHR